MSAFKSYKERIQKVLGEDQKIYFFWKGRVALYGILRALGICRSDEIILPALTCVVVPNAIMYLGAKPVYVDVNPDTFNIEPSLIQEKITSRTKVILAQNTFGLSPDLDPILALARKYKLWLIEDCAHGFGGSYKGQPNGAVADGAFFSSQWNKTFSTGIGGFSATRSDELGSKLEILLREACSPRFSENISLAAQIIGNRFFLNQATYWPALHAYRWLSRHNLVTGSSGGQELTGPTMPAHFFKKASKIQALCGKKELRQLEFNLSRRAAIAASYKQMCVEIGISPPFEPAYAAHTFIKFPLLARDRIAFLEDAARHRIELGDWFLSPIHPIRKNLDSWCYHWGRNPVAETLSGSLVNLPTHRKIDASYLKRIQEFLTKNRWNLFSSAQECLQVMRKRSNNALISKCCTPSE